MKKCRQPKVSNPKCQPNAHLLLHQKVGNDATKQQAQNVKALRQRNQHLAIAYQIEAGRNRMIVRGECKISAFDSREIVRALTAIDFVEPFNGRIHYFLVHVTVVDPRAIVAIGQLRMCSVDPVIQTVSWQRRWWRTMNIARLRRQGGEHQNGHEPRRRHFAQENDEHGSQLVFAEAAQHLLDGVLVRCCSGRHCGTCWTCLVPKCGRTETADQTLNQLTNSCTNSLK